MVQYRVPNESAGGPYDPDDPKFPSLRWFVKKARVGFGYIGDVLGDVGHYCTEVVRYRT